MKQHLLVMLLGVMGLTLGLVGCDGAEKDPLIGTWEFSIYLSGQELAAMAAEEEEEMPEDVTMSMSMSGTTTYAEDGGRESDGEISLDMMVMGESMSIVMNFTESGSWQRSESDASILVEEVATFELGSEDQMTDMILNQSPELRDSMSDMVGENTESRIISSSANQLVVEDLESGMEITLTRVQ